MTTDDLKDQLIAVYPSYASLIRSEIDWDHVLNPDTRYRWMYDRGIITDKERHDLLAGITTLGSSVVFPAQFANAFAPITTAYPFSIGRSAGSFRTTLEPRDLVDPAIFSGAEYYVKPETGDGANGGTGWDDALRTIHSAITLGNATNAPFRVYIDGTEKALESNLSSNGNVEPSEACALIGVGGSVECVLGKPVDDPTWTLVTGTTYKASISSVKRCLNFDDLDSYGLPADLEEKGSQAATEGQVDSYYFDNAEDEVFVNIGGDPDGKIMVLRNFKGLAFDSHADDLYLENITIYGGGTGCMDLSATAERNVVGKNVSFIAPGSANKGSSPEDSVAISNTGGLIAFFDSSAHLSHKDNWNFHENSAASTPFVIMDNCYGYKAGNDSDSSSNNFTTHDAIVALVVDGHYAEVNYGSNIHCIQDTLTYMVGVKAVGRDTDGDATAFQCSNDAYMWLEDCSADASGQSNNYSIEANGGTVFKRRLTTVAGTEYAYSGGSIQEF